MIRIEHDVSFNFHACCLHMSIVVKSQVGVSRDPPEGPDNIRIATYDYSVMQCHAMHGHTQTACISIHIQLNMSSS